MVTRPSYQQNSRLPRPGLPWIPYPLKTPRSAPPNPLPPQLTPLSHRHLPRLYVINIPLAHAGARQTLRMSPTPPMLGNQLAPNIPAMKQGGRQQLHASFKGGKVTYILNMGWVDGCTLQKSRDPNNLMPNDPSAT